MTGQFKLIFSYTRRKQCKNIHMGRDGPAQVLRAMVDELFLKKSCTELAERNDMDIAGGLGCYLCFMKRVVDSLSFYEDILAGR